MTDTNTQISAMLNGEIQGVDVRTGSVAAQMEAIDGLKNITNATGATVGFTHINMNMADTPFADVLVRQAIMYGLDRESSAQGVTEGLGHALNQYAVEGSYAYLEDPTYTYDYDPEKAKELLTEAGYPNGFDTTIDTSTTYEKQAVALQSYLDAIGINAEIKMNDTATLTDLEQGGTFAGMTVMSGSVASNDPTNFIDRLMGPNRTRFLASALQDEEFFTLLTEEPYAKTTEERNEYCQQIGKYINENLPILPWYYMANPYYVVDNLYGTHYYSVQAWQWTPDTAYLAA